MCIIEDTKNEDKRRYEQLKLSKLYRLCESDTVPSQIVHCVVFPKENIAYDPNGTHRFWYVESHKTRDALILDFKDVVGRIEAEVPAIEDEAKLGERRDSVTIKGVLAGVVLLGSNFLVDELSEGGGKDEERRTSVDGCSDGFNVNGIITKLDIIKPNLPVAPACDRGVVDLARVVGGVNAAKDGLAFFLARIDVVEVE